MLNSDIDICKPTSQQTLKAARGLFVSSIAIHWLLDATSSKTLSYVHQRMIDNTYATSRFRSDLWEYSPTALQDCPLPVSERAYAFKFQANTFDRLSNIFLSTHLCAVLIFFVRFGCKYWLLNDDSKEPTRDYISFERLPWARSLASCCGFYLRQSGHKME